MMSIIKHLVDIAEELGILEEVRNEADRRMHRGVKFPSAMISKWIDEERASGKGPSAIPRGEMSPKFEEKVQKMVAFLTEGKKPSKRSERIEKILQRRRKIEKQERLKKPTDQE